MMMLTGILVSLMSLLGLIPSTMLMLRCVLGPPLLLVLISVRLASLCCHIALAGERHAATVVSMAAPLTVELIFMPRRLN
jgi:hypothetical protein